MSTKSQSKLCLLGFVLAASALAQWDPYNVLGNLASQTYATSWNPARRIAASANAVHVVWYDCTLPDRQINYRRSTNAGQSWAAPVALATAVDTWPDPTVAVAGSVVHVAWYQGPDSSGGVWYIRSTDGGQTWSQSRRLSDSLGWGSTRPSLAACGSDVHLVWLDARSGWEEIYYKRSTDAGATWGNDTRLGMDTLTLILGEPAVAASDSGVHVVWMTGALPTSIRYARSTNRGITWSGPTSLTTTYAVCPIDVACAGSAVHVAWTDLSGIWYRRSINNGGAWLATTQISSDSLWPDSPCLAASGTTVHAVWVHNYQGYSEVYYRRSTCTGATWEPEFNVSDYYILHRGNATVATSGTVVHVLWQDDRDLFRYELYHRRNAHNGAWVEEEQRTGRPRVGGEPAVVRDIWGTTASEETLLLDVLGRAVRRFEEGRNMQPEVAPGVYFLITPRNHYIRKLVVVR